MPLPKPPAKRADFLSREALESQAAAVAGKRSRRERPAARARRAGGHSMELRERAASLPAAPPVSREHAG